MLQVHLRHAATFMQPKRNGDASAAAAAAAGPGAGAAAALCPAAAAGPCCCANSKQRTIKLIELEAEIGAWPSKCGAVVIACSTRAMQLVVAPRPGVQTSSWCVFMIVLWQVSAKDRSTDTVLRPKATVSAFQHPQAAHTSGTFAVLANRASHCSTRHCSPLHQDLRLLDVV